MHKLNDFTDDEYIVINNGHLFWHIRQWSSIADATAIVLVLRRVIDHDDVQSDVDSCEHTKPRPTIIISLCTIIVCLLLNLYTGDPLK